MRPFTHLHGHSMFSNLIQPDALPRPEDLVARAKELGLASICITDHGSISGVPHLAKAAKKEGVKPIVGSELYVVSDTSWRPAGKEESRKDYNHCIAIAQDWEGLQELFGLLSRANSPGQFYYKPRNSFDELKRTKKLIFLTACGGGILAREDHLCVLQELRDAVGPDRIYVEIQPHWDPRQSEINKRAVAAAGSLGLKLVATQDFHYARPGEHLTHEVLLAIGSKDVWSNPDRWKYPVDDLFIKTREEMLRAFLPHVTHKILPIPVIAHAFENADAIADRTEFELRKVQISLPDMGPEPILQVTQHCLKALKASKHAGDREYWHRLSFEVEVINGAGFASYLLMLKDIVDWCREQNIMVGPGRGSSAGSLVCYLLGITRVDPILHGLLFERFYRPGRVDLPDIDTDFEDERREEVLRYIRDRWGDDHVAMVANYMTVKARGALNDVARVFEIDGKEVHQATAQISVPDIQIDDYDAERRHDEQVFADPAIAAFFARHPGIEEHCRRLSGWMRGTGQHAAGVVIAGVPLSERAAISTREDRRVVCWDKRIIEDMGLMKLDVLGLRTLAILRNAAELVFRRSGRKVDYDAIPLDDAKALDVFQRGETTGVFQFESGGMRRILKSLRVDSFYVLCDTTSLYRPGPMEMVPAYTLAQTGAAPPRYAHPLLEPILKPTYGIVIYQEQLMRIFVDLAGFTFAEADNMRKIVGKKLGPDEFRKHEQAFLDGCAKKGVDDGVARATFASMVSFAGYAFNKSHAVAYSIISFWCAYMKAHHPAEFYAAHLSSSNEEQCQLAVREAADRGIEVLMPDVNASLATKYDPLTSTKIIAPLSAVKGVGEKAAQLIFGARQGIVDSNGLNGFDAPRVEAKRTVAFDGSKVKKAPFADHADFEGRVYKRVVNKGVVEKLQAVGALPWRRVDPETLHVMRTQLLGHVYADEMRVEASERCDYSALVQDQLGRDVMAGVITKAHALKIKSALPVSGTKPQVMLVFSNASWREVSNGTMGEGAGFELVRKLLLKRVKIDRGSLYVTALRKLAKPPLGHDALEEDYRTWLATEVQLLKPPIVVTFGAEAAEFFAGKGTKLSEVIGRVRLHGPKTQVIFAKSPFGKGLVDAKSGETESDEAVEEFAASFCHPLERILGTPE